MQFHFEKTLEKRYEPQVTVTNETPAWLMICLAESIKDWIGQSPRIFCKSEEPYLQFGYEVLTFPVAEFAQIFGPLIYAINQAGLCRYLEWEARMSWSSCPSQRRGQPPLSSRRTSPGFHVRN